MITALGTVASMLLVAAGTPLVSRAQCSADSTSACSPIPFATIFELTTAILQAVILIVFPIVVLLLVYTGFLFVTAQGNSSKIEAAKRALLWTIIGALIVLGAQALSLAIKATVDEIRTGTTP